MTSNSTHARSRFRPRGAATTITIFRASLYTRDARIEPTDLRQIETLYSECERGREKRHVESRASALTCSATTRRVEFRTRKNYSYVYMCQLLRRFLSLSRPFSSSVFVSLLSSGEERERGNSLWGIMQSRVRVCFVPCGTSGNDRKRKREREKRRSEESCCRGRRLCVYGCC